MKPEKLNECVLTILDESLDAKYEIILAFIDECQVRVEKSRNVIRMLVPNTMVSLLIGKGGK
jgi:hypothetical protein